MFNSTTDVLPLSFLILYAKSDLFVCKYFQVLQFQEDCNMG